MDNRAANSVHDLFSRGATPPGAMSSSQNQPQYGPAIHSTANPPAPSQIDSLFQNIGNTQEHHLIPQQQDNYNNSSPTMSLLDVPGTVGSPSNSTSAECQSAQNALLSLLGAPTNAAIRNAQPLGPQLVPTPPGSQQSGTSPTHNETQGKILLDQLMIGNQPQSNYSDSQRGSQGAPPSPPYSQQREGQYILQDPAIEVAQRAVQPVQPPPPQQQQQQQQHQQIASQQSQQQGGSPRRSMFEFVSPFDALATKKKPAPPPQVSAISSGTDDSSWTAVDPKRQSVDNLLEHLTRQTQPTSYDSHGGYSDFSQPEQQRAPAVPIATKAAAVPGRTASPRGSPPKPHGIRAPGRFAESPSSQQGGNGRRDKDSSPGPRGGGGSVRGGAKGPQGKQQNKQHSSPTPTVQNIVFDVSQPLHEIQAPQDYVKSTAIALVRQDSVFLPGTTIGATHWVAYAMTRGRVRVISRSSGDRTLLQLPQVFPTTSSVSDMAVNGNRLAGVTTDGGFVIWELPEVITDDVPGQLVFCVPPSPDADPLLSVKWHPKESETLAVASESQIYLIDLANTYALHGQTLALSDLHHLGQLFSIPSPIVAFDFDIMHYALATISVDSTLTIWNIHDRLPYATHKLRADDAPSSLTFVDNGIVVGRKNGTVFQLLSNTNKNVLSTIKFVNGATDDPDMFGHVTYDARIQTLWVANCRRESMIAFKINVDPSAGDDAARGFFDQVVEFSGPKPTIHFVILTADSDPNGEEAYAACVAAKQHPGELALVAFSVHSSGVDQILIRKEWFDSALVSTVSRFPNAPTPQASNSQAKQPVAGTSLAPTRIRTPPSEEVEAENKVDEGRIPEPKPKGSKAGKNVNFKENKDDNNKASKSGDSSIINETALGQALSKEIRKTEENLHTRIGRLIGKEMDKQHQRLEDARAHEQAEDFARQEKILKLISTELTRNTTRVVEMAVKSEVQNSVLPSLENITRTEVKAALGDQVSRLIVDVLSQSIPTELEKLLLRPDITPHLSRVLTSSLSPTIERYVKDGLTKTIIQQSTSLHQELLNEIRNDMHKLKSDLAGWQNDTVRAQESSIRELDRNVRALSEQVKFLTMNTSASMHGHHLQQQPSHSQHAQHPQHSSHNSPSGSNLGLGQPQGGHGPSHLRQGNNMQGPPPGPPGPSGAVQPSLSSQGGAPAPPIGYNNFQAAPSQAAPPQQWFSPIAAPQASHLATLPQPTAPVAERTPPMKADQWDELYLGVLHTQDTNKLRALLAETNPELIMPLSGTPLVSQAVILTLVHRLSSIVGENSPNDEAFKTSLWWLQRSVTHLRPEDKLISDFIPRVIPNVQLVLNNTKQRLAILPGGPTTLDTARTISDVQEGLRRKVGV